MAISTNLANRLGFLILGLTNNFAYVIMLSAAYDLLKQSETVNNQQATSVSAGNATQKYCNEQSTSTILLADTIPSLTVKLLYPFVFVELPTIVKVLATAIFSAASFLATGLFTNQILIFTGVAFASFSSGLGESTYLSNTPLYGDVSLSGWSMGTGGAGLLGAAAYALLSMILPIKYIMILMLVVPIAMMFAYLKVIRPIDQSKNGPRPTQQDEGTVARMSVISTSPSDGSDKPMDGDITNTRVYGSSEIPTATSSDNQLLDAKDFDFKAKFKYLPTLSKYFLPLLLVYFAEYFINQGLFELIYYPEVPLDHAAQYRWFQVSYQLGVLISRSSLDLFIIRRLWTMSLLQSVNALLFLAHTSKLIHIPSFYLVIAIIIYEGLLGGFTYANTFYRIKSELSPERQEFGISTVTIADTLGIVIAGSVAIPVHNTLCKLYT